MGTICAPLLGVTPSVISGTLHLRGLWITRCSENVMNTYNKRNFWNEDYHHYYLFLQSQNTIFGPTEMYNAAANIIQGIKFFQNVSFFRT